MKRSPQPNNVISITCQSEGTAICFRYKATEFSSRANCQQIHVRMHLWEKVHRRILQLWPNSIHLHNVPPSVCNKWGNIRSHLFIVLPLSKTTRFLQGTHFDDKKHTEAVQSTRSNGSTPPQMKQSDYVSTLYHSHRPHKVIPIWRIPCIL
jgi:hypothetical protein